MTDETDENAPARPAAKRKPAPSGRKAVISKLWKAAQTQLEAHEAHLAELPAGAAASEVDAKTLATLARTVRELVALDSAAAGEGGKSEDEPSPAEGLRRVDELRRELGRRLAVLAAEEAGTAGAPPHGDGLT
ncbi:conserved hypothetical protein [Bosea sp. 62]|uniref:hypothetical protein n=1 Tax=unclassified Bosea (in: a-proteobacteria) TaxID=2653178 RepID=UPI001259257C|nr:MULTISPECIES: hypothetical protein [unclassified Bosea (in: a-proteobacteria)]CAD5289870.1 conserved hypothetical protein [Bosea sp. 7B]CAD5300225.1 conserved hypothetical protein [Bosea sp. 21B]CAD5300699.1 conserved hypothetical protein [Bosea sp. 46]VVT61927.1 conserved hypothetical protein [Bosea sp. EC-HK365B]VXB46492.1 conserved hypothetical protein [Bosea sp. 125]